ncbi:unnamed protein product, partial [Porites lobata]
CILFTILQTSTSVKLESITATPMLSVTTLKALTVVHANQDFMETALTAQAIMSSVGGLTKLKALTFVHANQDLPETALTAQVKQ